MAEISRFFLDAADHTTDVDSLKRRHYKISATALQHVDEQCVVHDLRDHDDVHGHAGLGR